MNAHLYIVDQFREVAQLVNEALAGNFADWTDTTKLPTLSGKYRLQQYGEDFIQIGDLIVKNGDIIQNVEGINSLANSVNYMYGHPIEIANNLLELSKSELTKNMRYPLLALLTDFSEKKDSANYYAKSSLNFIIANVTDPNYKADQRTEKVFKPVLHPIYHEFIRQIEKSKFFLISYDETIPHTQVDRYYWGRNGTLDNEVWGKSGIYGGEGNIFNDYIDMVEIIGLEVKINNQFNSKNNLLK